MCTPMFKYLHVSVGTFWGPKEDTKSSGTGAQIRGLFGQGEEHWPEAAERCTLSVERAQAGHNSEAVHTSLK